MRSPTESQSQSQSQPQSQSQSQPQSRRKPLHGVRVADFTRVMAGPFCTQLLADLGADVIKIERPRSGDDTRKWGPPFFRDDAGGDTRESAYFSSCNRGKRSITLDISRAEGGRVARELVLKSDVLIENFKVGSLARHGLGYESLAQTHTGLVYCSITGFGQTGPYRARPGYDTIMQAMGGLMSITGRPDGTPGGGPLKAGIAVTDIMTGLYASVAILAALRDRARSGQGQYIDLSLFDVQVASLTNIAANYFASGQVPQRLGNRLPTLYPSDAFQCSDGHIMIIGGNDSQFRKICEALGTPELAIDVRFAHNEARLRNASELARIMEARLCRRAVSEWVTVLEKAGVACGPINSIDQVFADPQVVARGMSVNIPHSTAGSMPGIANPIRFSETAVDYRVPPPVLGQHTSEVLSEILGLSNAEIDRLCEQGVT